MPRDPSTTLKYMAFAGLLLFVFLWLASLGLKQSLQPDETQRVAAQTSKSGFDGERALRLAASLSAPPIPDGPPNDSLPKRIAAAWRSAGLEVVSTEAGVAATIPGGRPGGIVLLAAQREGVPGAEADAALLAELARLIEPRPIGRPVHLAWLAQGADAASLLAPLAPAAILVIEGVGDCYLRVSGDPSAPEWMRERLLDAAEWQGYREHFSRTGPPPEDWLGLRATYPNTLHLRDPIWGGSLTEHARLTQPGADTSAAICPNSLQAVGDVLVQVIPAWEAGLGAS